MRSFRNDNQAVTEVLGQILLVGITITMMGGLTALVLNVDGPVDQTHVELRFTSGPGAGGWGTGDEAIQILHQGGEAMPQDTTVIRIRINGVPTDFEGGALTGGFTDGHLTIGETWTATQTLELSDEIEILVLDRAAGAIVGSSFLNLGEAGGAAGATLTYVTSATAHIGAVDQIGKAQSAADGNQEAIFDETGASSINNDFSAFDADDGGVGSENNVLENDFNRGDFRDADDWAEVSDWTELPPAATSIEYIEVIFEAGQQRTSSGSDPDFTLELSINGGSIRQQTFVVANKYTEDEGDGDGGEVRFSMDVTADRSWTVADIQDPTLTARLTRVDERSGFALVEVDWIGLNITYGLAGGSNMEIDLDFTGVPGGTQHQVELEYRRSGDTFHVEVQNNGGVWVERGVKLTSGVSSVWTYSIDTSTEYQAGTIRIRFIDETPGGASAGQILLDYARIRTT